MDPNYLPPFSSPAVPSGLLSMRPPYPRTNPWDRGFNIDWGPAQQQEFLLNANLLNANQMASSGPSITGLAPTNDHVCRCKWLMDGILCNQAFADFDELIVHMGGIHDVQGFAARKLVCQWSTASGGCCGKKYRRDGFRRHIGTHVGRSVPCTECGKRFSRKDSMRSHLKKRHGKK